MSKLTFNILAVIFSLVAATAYAVNQSVNYTSSGSAGIRTTSDGTTNCTGATACNLPNNTIWDSVAGANGWQISAGHAGLVEGAGTAGAAAGGVLSIQGVASGTVVPVGGSTGNNTTGQGTSITNVPTVAYNYGFNGVAWDRLLVDGSDNLKVTSVGAISNAASAVATIGTNIGAVSYNYGFNGTTWDQLQVDASKFLKVNCSAGCSSGSVSNATSGVATSSTNLGAVSYNYAFNGTTWDQLKSTSNSLNIAMVQGGNTQTVNSNNSALIDANTSSQLHADLISPIAAGTATIGGVFSVPTTSGGLTWSLLTPAGGATASGNLKASAGQVYKVVSTNSGANGTVYLRLYNTSGTPTCSSATNEVYAVAIPSPGIVDTQLVGISGFSSGIGYCITGAFGNTDTTNIPATPNTWINVGYN